MINEIYHLTSLKIRWLRHYVYSTCIEKQGGKNFFPHFDKQRHRDIVSYLIMFLCLEATSSFLKFATKHYIEDEIRQAKKKNR